MAGDWSVADTQYVHVGEEVAFDFVISKPGMDRPIDPRGLAEYAVLTVGPAQIISEADGRGHFTFVYKFEDVAPGTELPATATAYRVLGAPDRSLFSGTRTADASDEPDQRLARDTVRMITYQSEVVIEIEQTSPPLDFESARLQLFPDDEGVSVYPAMEGGRGFSVDGPVGGRYTIRYAPTAAQVNDVGETRADLTVYDEQARRHSRTVRFPTP